MSRNAEAITLWNETCLKIVDQCTEMGMNLLDEGKDTESLAGMDLAEDVLKLRKQKEALVAALKEAKIAHNNCEDAWYSCPKSEDGCADDQAGDDCTCVAERHNTAIDAAIKAAEEEV